MTNPSKEELEPLAKVGLCSREIALKLGVNQKYVQKLLKKYDLPRLKRGDASQMEKNHFWKGGRVVDKGGYILIKNNQHPFCSACGYVREHRLVMENHLKRYLTPKEVVHHINGVRDDNRVENLILFQTNGQHLKTELTGKIPKWSPSGKARILKSVRQPRG